MNKLVRMIAATAIAAGSITAVTVAGPAPAAYACDQGTTKTWTPEMVAFAHSLPALHEGNQNGYVLGLQAALIKQGHHELDGTGYFGSVTKAAVQAWQRKNGINPSGQVGVQTWSSLIINDRYVPGKLPAPQLAPGGRWTEGTGYVEEGIIRLTQVFPSWAPAIGIRNGSYQASEVRVVQRFQQRSGINPSGIIGVQTTSAFKVVSALTGGFAC